jgi:hypothetical protein
MGEYINIIRFMFLLTRHTDSVGNDEEKTEINYRLIYFHLPPPEATSFYFHYFLHTTVSPSIVHIHEHKTVKS